MYTVEGSVGWNSTWDTYPVRGCVEVQVVFLSAAGALSLWNTNPVDVPKTTRFGSAGETAIVLMVPAAAGSLTDAAVQFCAPSLVRQRTLPPRYRRLGWAGSITNGMMNWKLALAVSVMPFCAVVKPLPPLVV